MRAQISARSLVQNGEQTTEEFFPYKDGQHRVVSNGEKQKNNGKNGKLHLPEEVKIARTKNGKRWSTSSMGVELAEDILEVRDGLGKVVDAVVLKQKKTARKSAE
ncbi:hypothetical protein KKB40_04500 [Patescibacteria group bacterium]|nr:hypothetical protein [Patescibacteria group bacterium]